MKSRIMLVAGVLALAAFAVSCGDSNSREGDAAPTVVVDQTPRASPTVQVQPTATENPSEGGGISALEAIRDAATANDVGALAGFIRYTPTACAADQQGSAGRRHAGRMSRTGQWSMSCR